MSVTITCPVCGPRDGYEFRFGGEDKGPRPETEALSAPEAWVDFVHMNRCAAAVQQEWWYHRDGCGSWFTIQRDTRTNAPVSPEEEAP